MNVVIPKEITPGERRVAATPDVVGRMVKSGNQCTFSRALGTPQPSGTSSIECAGATLGDGAPALFAKAGLVIKVQRPQDDEVAFSRRAAHSSHFSSRFLRPNLPRNLRNKTLLHFPWS